jgi:hypothetical protein
LECETLLPVVAALSRSQAQSDPFVQKSFKVYIKGFPEMAGIRKFVRIVAGLETGDKAEARDTLDSLFAAEKIRDLDHQLRLLEINVKSARVASSARDFYKITGDENAAALHKPEEPDLKGLMQLGLVRLLNQFKAKIDEFPIAGRLKNGTAAKNSCVISATSRGGLMTPRRLPYSKPGRCLTAAQGRPYSGGSKKSSFLHLPCSTHGGIRSATASFWKANIT